MNTTPTIRTAVALVIVIAGVAVIGFIPYSRWKGTRDRGDFERARTPLVRVSVGELPPDRERTMTVILPKDRQWQRIVNRLGKLTSCWSLQPIQRRSTRKPIRQPKRVW